jgi:hypothetical protein
LVPSDAPPVILYDVVELSYDQGAIKQKIRAGEARVHHDRIVFTKTFNAGFYEEDSKFLESERAVFYHQDGFKDPLSKKGLVELFGGVRLRSKNVSIKTEKAVYDRAANLVSGKDPVRLSYKEGWVVGENGFSYYITSEEFSIFHKVRGVVY